MDSSNMSITVNAKQINFLFVYLFTKNCMYCTLKYCIELYRIVRYNTVHHA